MRDSSLDYAKDKTSVVVAFTSKECNFDRGHPTGLSPAQDDSNLKNLGTLRNCETRLIFDSPKARLLCHTSKCGVLFFGDVPPACEISRV